ncbi:AAA family ATPase [Enterobacter hormaechei]|nr:AAA family ATPase [Enterobacter hormaechei]
MFNVIKAVEERNSKTRNPDLSFEEIIWIFNTWKAHYLVEKYNEYKVEKNKINTSVDSFIKILNDLFEGRKTFFVSKSNELCAYSSDGYEIKLSDLSSGEKQLLIILSEALLQNGKRCLYLADEPELSLHVSWQEKIVNSIFEINKNVQIIFATHSPDVVSWRQDKTIFMSGE